MSIIPSQSYRKCGNTEVDIYLYSGLGPLQFNGSSCYPYAVLGFLTDVDINDPDINTNSNFSSTYNYPYNPSYPSCSDEISVVSDIQILGNNLVITKTTVRIPSIDIVHGVGILDTLESCDGLYPNSTNSNSISVSNNPCSGYNTSSVQLITDIFIEENKIKYKSATIKVSDVSLS